MHKLIEENKRRLSEICQKHFVKKLSLFGSFARGDFQEKSDIDFLYEIDTERFHGWATGDYDYADNIFSLEKELISLFKRQVDLVSANGVRNKYLKSSIEQSNQVVYAA